MEAWRTPRGKHSILERKSAACSGSSKVYENSLKKELHECINNSYKKQFCLFCIIMSKKNT
ncbi:hypothetical protein BIV59_20845 [Bacillus sp. MUM 13]|nr:hypothetical protein BIV59_20845 [Bacillus sp. MUM 13]